jgi:hypothetical protein
MGFDPITSKLKVHKIITYDLEWIPETLEFRLGGIFDGENYKCATTLTQFLKILFTPEHEGAYLYAHAGGMADLLFLLEEISKHPTVKVEGTFSGSSAVFVQVRVGKHVWTLLDSYWLLRDKLAHLGKMSGLEKTRDSYQCPHFPACGHIGRACASAPSCGCPEGPEPLCMFYSPLPILRDYNERDCRILHGAISRFQTELNEMGTDLRITIASTAMRLFRRKYLLAPIATNPVMSDRVRAAYIASRVEPYRAEAHDEINEWDINSSFPFAMTLPTPGGYIGSVRRRPSKGLYFAQCRVRVPPMFLPPLGKRGLDRRIYFPVGSWSGLFSAPDLELLEEAGGRIEKIEEVLLFESRTDFSDYATDLYERRRVALDPFVKILLKYLLNSCYGKTAESREKTRLVLHPYSEKCPHDGIHDTETGASCVEVLFPGAILVTETKDIAHEHVPIAAQITSEARRTLWRYSAQCGEDLYYSDTDSVYTHHCFEETDKLGGVKLARKCPPPSLFISPKLYLAGGKVKSKGFSHLSEEKFRSLIGGEPVAIERMLRIREMARSHALIAPQMARVEKRLSFNARPKRRAVPGNITEPWRVQDIESKWTPEREAS